MKKLTDFYNRIAWKHLLREYHHPGQSVAEYAIGLSCVALVVLALCCLLRPVFPSIPLTDHAWRKQVDATWSVAAIAGFMHAGKCNTIDIYTCPEVVKYTCPLTDPDKLWLGIIVGDKYGQQVVITGWLAPRRVWDRLGERDHCVKTTVYLPSNLVVP